MRKDVKVGLAVGGVLLAVLVIYVLVVPGTNTNQIGATLEPVEGFESSDGAANDAGAVDSAVSRGESTGNDRTAGAGNSSRGNSSDVQRDDVTGADASAGAGSTNDGADSANRGASTSDRAAGETAGGWNWDALVNGTEKLPSMGAGADIPLNDSNVALVTGSIGNDATPAGHDAGAFGDASTNSASSENPFAAGGNNAADSNTSSASATSVDAAPLPETTAAGWSQSPTRQDAAIARPSNVASTPVTTTARTHVVKVGETYSSISSAAYGSSKFYAHIEHANPGIDPTRLKPGTTITLPAIDTKPAAAGAAVRQPPQKTVDARTEYKVQPNDSLYTISIRLYGKADRVDKLYDLNRAAIGDDMARVKVGMVLKLPEPPTRNTVAATAR